MLKVDLESIWNKCLIVIESKVGSATYELWFSPIELVKLKDNEAVLKIPNRFFMEWIEDNHPLLIEESLERIVSKKINVTYKVEQKYDDRVDKIDEKLQSRRVNLAKKGIYLTPKYTFENFVIGPSNQFAHAASLAVSENPGKAYNPLFVYGDVGLGKTHIINAIGNRIIDRRDRINILYVSAEQFTNEVVSAIRHEKMGELKDKYRNLDILLLDDIHFIAKKTQTQEEFFHTFNTLYEKQKQIVISCDRPPKDIGEITDRLKSRFIMGLVADIQPPTVELKMAILQKKSEAENIKLPDDVITFLAMKIRSNIRELEGCLIKLAAHSTLTGNPINLSMTKHVLKDLFFDDTKPITVEHIQKKVCDYFSIKPMDIKARKRTKEVAIPRQIAMHISKRLTNLSLYDIGRAFGRKNHATVIYACRQVEEKMDKDEDFSKTIEKIIDKIKS